jgi:hypothetical protein
MDQRFQIRLDQPQSTLIREEELGELIARLDQSADHPEQDYSSQPTVASVVEATGSDIGHVIETLTQMRNERMSAVLRELEEPLYRVERTSPSNADPILGASLFSRFRQRNSVLDELQTTKWIVISKNSRSREDTELDRAAFRSSLIVSLGLILVMILAILAPLLKKG